jgi:hypothetical protein
MIPESEWDYDTPAYAYQVWQCSRCDSEPQERNGGLVCETCGTKFGAPSMGGIAREIPEDDDESAPDGD